MSRESKALKQANSEWSRWYIVQEKNGGTELVNMIKRYCTVDGKTKWERYPAKQYRGLNQSDTEALLRRLNASYEIDRANAEARYNFSHAYINQISLKKFEDQIEKNSNDPSHTNNVIQILNDHVFEFFVIQCNLPDPSRWHLKETEWGKWLLKKELGASTLKRIVSTANRFNKFLVDRMYPEMTTPRKLEPHGKRILDAVEKAQSRKFKVKTRHIKPEVFERILKAAERTCPEVIPNMKLCYAFGFRISETLGLTREKFLKDCILVNEQGDRIAVAEDGSKSVSRKKVKTYDRRVPYWNMTAKEAWALVKEIGVMHPDTLIRRVNAVLEPFEHTSHDFRRTFITNSFRKAHWKDVMKAAGHSDVRTTMGYDQDDRDLSEDLADLD